MEKIFLTVLNMSITAGWLVLAVILLRLVLKKAPKSIRCILWALVGIRLVCPFSVECLLSLIPSAETVPQDIVYSEAPAIHSGIYVLNSTVNPIISQALPELSDGADTITGMIPSLSGSTPMRLVSIAASVIWLAGAAVMLLYMLVSRLRLQKKLRESVRLDSNVWLCDRIGSPFILGIFRPQIYLPTDLNEEDTKCVLAHENAHIKRRDYLWKPLGFLLLAVYWFNPLMWTAYILLCRDIELACDERVLREYGEEIKKPYSEALINCSAERRTISACPLAFGEVGVKTRIKNVLSYKKPTLWIIIAALVICGAVTVFFMTNPIDEAQNVIDFSDSDTKTWRFRNELKCQVDDRTSFDCAEVTINKYGNATFSFSYLSSYIVVGKYEVKDGKLIIKPDIGKYEVKDGKLVIKSDNGDGEKYVFRISGTKLIFEDGSSSKIPSYRYFDTDITARKAVPDGAVFESCCMNPDESGEIEMDDGELKPYYDVISADIDGDGREENCTLGYGRTSGVFSFTLTVAENGKTEYSGNYVTCWYDLSFVTDSSGAVQVRGVNQSGEVHLFDIELKDGVAYLMPNVVNLGSGTQTSLDDYYGLSDFKGLELYVLKISDGAVQVRGVNRSGEVHLFDIDLKDGVSYLTPNVVNLGPGTQTSLDDYYGLSDFKGLELYVWKISDGEYRFGLMEGTNRIKTDGEISMLYPATAEEMNAVLATYDTPDDEISIIPVQMPVYGYLWEPDEDGISALRDALGLSQAVNVVYNWVTIDNQAVVSGLPE